MFEHMLKHDVILVVGAQRSGTSLVSAAIASDLGYTLVPEEAYGVHDVRMWEAMVDRYTESVIHSPAMTHVCDMYGMSDRVGVVLVKRDKTDIWESQVNIGWFSRGENERELEKYGLLGGSSIEVKYQYWELQKMNIKHWYEVEYEKMREHKLWIDKEARHGWGHRQTS